MFFACHVVCSFGGLFESLVRKSSDRRDGRRKPLLGQALGIQAGLGFCGHTGIAREPAKIAILLT
jgi:hypothetical protein